MDPFLLLALKRVLGALGIQSFKSFRGLGIFGALRIQSFKSFRGLGFFGGFRVLEF